MLPLRIEFKPGMAAALCIEVKCLLTEATTYDVLLGMEALFPPGFIIDLGTENAFYRPSWAHPTQLACIPLDLHGAQGPRHALLARSDFQVVCVRMDAAQERCVYHSACEYVESLEDEEVLTAVAQWAQQSKVPPELSPSTVSALRHAKQLITTAIVQLQTPTQDDPERPVALQPVRSWTPPNQGITLVELFGGIAAGLEVALKAGLVVHKYVYVDADSTARTVAQARVRRLQQDFPRQLSKSACQAAFSSWPQDIRLIQESHVAMVAPVQLVIAGWECQGLSLAGAGDGLKDARTRLFHELMRVMHLINLHS